MNADPDAMRNLGRIMLGALVVSMGGLLRIAYLEWRGNKTDRAILDQLRSQNPALTNRSPLGRISGIVRAGKLAILKRVRRA